MGSFPGKVIGVFLSFILLAFVPMVIVILSQNIKVERITWNAVTYYADVVADKGILTSRDYEDFVAKLGASTVDYDITISVQRRMVFPDTGNGIEVKYVSSGIWKSSAVGVVNDEALEAGDNLQIVLKPLSHTHADNVLRSILGLYVVRQPISYATHIRNSGG